jgi:hypothetical protein
MSEEIDETIGPNDGHDMPEKTKQAIEIFAKHRKKTINATNFAEIVSEHIPSHIIHPGRDGRVYAMNAYVMEGIFFIRYTNRYYAGMMTNAMLWASEHPLSLIQLVVQKIDQFFLEPITEEQWQQLKRQGKHLEANGSYKYTEK